MMVIEVSAESSSGNVTEMLVWSDSLPNSTWQEFYPYVILPTSDWAYVQFKDEFGNLSEVVSVTTNHSAPPVAADPLSIYLPTISKPENYKWIDASIGGTVVALGDDTYQYVELPFLFRFYGNTYSGIYVSSNGFISFGSGYSTYTNSCIPSSSNPNNAIYAFWDDLLPNGGSNGNVYVKHTDANTFVIEWHGVKRVGGNDHETFEILLKEGNNIKIQYKTISNITSATVGIENSTGSIAKQYLCNGVGNPINNESFIYFIEE